MNKITLAFLLGVASLPASAEVILSGSFVDMKCASVMYPLTKNMVKPSVNDFEGDYYGKPISFTINKDEKAYTLTTELYSGTYTAIQFNESFANFHLVYNGGSDTSVISFSKVSEGYFTYSNTGSTINRMCLGKIKYN